MPATYKDLLLETVPVFIETDEEYEAIHRRLSELVRKRHDRTPQETRFMRLLGLLVQDYDRRHALPPEDATPAERLQYLLEASGKKPADLVPIFRTVSHVSEAVNGKRPISADHARQLGAMFHLAPGYFL
jgi:HTH-type transcriptional regulator/antitoxin HigA